MQSSVEGGRILYTVEVDDSALASLPKDFNKVGDSARQSSNEVRSSFKEDILNGLLGAIESSKAAFVGLGDTATNIASGLTNIFSSLSGVQLPDFGDVNSILGSLNGGVETLGKIEDSVLAITKLTGSQQIAEEAIARIRREAASTPFGIGDLSKYVQQLTASTKDADKAIDTVMAFGKALKIAGAPLSELNALSVNLQQMYSSGATLSDIRQFQARIPMFNDMLAQVGLTVDDIKVSADDTAADIQRKAKLTTDAIMKYGEDISWESFGDNFNTIKDNLEEVINNTFTDAMESSGGFDFLKDTMKNMANAVEESTPVISDALESLVDVFKDIDFTQLFTAAAGAFKGFADTLKTIIPIFKNVATFLGGGDLSKGVGRIVQLATGFALFSKASKTLSPAVGAIKGVAGAFSSITGIFSKGKGLSNLSKGISQASSTISQTQGKFSSFGSGMMKLAVSFGIVAGAIALINYAIPSEDLGSLIAKLGIAAGVMTALVAIGKVIDKIKINTKAIGQLTLLAGELALWGVAIWAFNAVMPDDFGGLQAKMGSMALIMVEMGALVTVASAVSKKFGKDVVKGMALIAAMSIEMIGVAAAIKAFDAVMPDNFGGLQAKVGSMALIMAEMGALVTVLGLVATKLTSSVIAGVITVAAVALELVGVGRAIKDFDQNMPSDFGGLQAKIGSMALVITEVLAVAGIIGAIEVFTGGVGAVVIAAGLATMLGIIGDLVLVGRGLKDFDQNMPSDFGGLQAKIGSMSAVAGEMSALGVALGAAQFLSLGTLNVGLLTLVEISWTLAETGKNIRAAVEAIPDDLEQQKPKIDAALTFLKDLKDKYGGSGGLLPAIGNFFWNGEGTEQFDTFVKISQKVAEVAKNIGDITDSMPDPAKLNSVTGSLDSAIQFLKDLKEKFGSSGGLLPAIGNFFWNGEGTDQFETFNKISSLLKTLAENLEALADSDVPKIKKVVEGPLFDNLSAVCKKISEEFTGPNGFLPTLGKILWEGDSTAYVDKANKVSQVLIEICDNLAKIGNVNPNKIKSTMERVFPRLKEVTEYLYKEFTSEQGFLAFLGNAKKAVNTEDLEASAKIAEVIAGMVENLEKIGQIDHTALSKLTSQDSEKNVLMKIKAVVLKIKGTFVDDADSVTNVIANYDLKGLENVKAVVENIKAIAEALSTVGSITIDESKIGTFLTTMKNIVTNITTNFKDIEGLSEEVKGKIQIVKDVCSLLSEMATSLNSIPSIDSKTIIKNINSIKTVITHVRDVFDNSGKDAFDLEAFRDDTIKTRIEEVKNIVSFLKTIAEESNGIPSINAQNIITNINSVKSVIEHIRNVFDMSGKDAFDLSAFDGTINLDSIPSVVTRLKEIANIAKDFPDASAGGENLKNFATKLAEALKTLVDNLRNTNLAEDLKDLGSDLSESLLLGMEEKLIAEESTSGIHNAIYELVNLEEGSEKWKEAGKLIGGQIVTGLGEQIASEESKLSLSTALQTLLGGGAVGGATEGGTTGGGPYSELGNQLGKQLLTGINIYLSGEEAKILFHEAISGLLDLVESTSWLTFGNSMASSLVDGMVLYLSGDECHVKFYDAITYLLDIAESTNWYEFGVHMGTKLTEGLSAYFYSDVAAVQLISAVNYLFSMIESTNWFQFGETQGKDFVRGVVSDMRLYAFEVKSASEYLQKVIRDTNWKGFGRDIGTEFVTGVSDRFKQEGVSSDLLKGGVDQLWYVIKDYSYNNHVGWYNIGKYVGGQVIDGIVKGLNNGYWSVRNAAKQLAEGIKKELTLHLKIASPSRVMMWYGEMVGEGLAIGIESTADQVAEATEAIVNTARVGLAELDNISVNGSVQLAKANNGTGNSVNKSVTFNQTNNINNGLDASALLAQLRWDLERS